MVTVSINGKEVQAPQDKTILQICREQNIDNIPTLCYDDKLPPFGSCFLCVVEVEGQSRLFPSCATRPAEGMKIHTRSKRVVAARKTCLELLLSDHYADCFGPCRLSCPADVDIQGYMSLVNLGKFKEAVALIKETNPLPSVCGRVCTRKCEVGCRRNLMDEPVGIDFLKRYATDQDMIGEMWTPETKPDNGHRVAIVGGGPAGLTAAYYLVIEGYRPTIFEAKEHLGGMLRYGIPEYRLPRDVLDKEINWITDLGVDVQTGKMLGKDFQIDDLFSSGYEAVFVGLGAQVGKPMRVENEDVEGVLSGVEFLDQVETKTNPDVKGRVVVVGGGNTAIDAARTSLRLGATEVILLYRRTRNEMPANVMEIDAADEEGVKMEFLAAPVRVNSGESRLESLECIRMELGEPDDSGRRRPVTIKGSEYTLDCDWVISAIGQEPDLDGITNDDKIETTRWKTIEAKEGTFETDRPGVFAGGDVVTGPADAIDAIAAGHAAANAIDRYIKTEIVEPLRKRFESKRDVFQKVTIDDLNEADPAARHGMPELSPKERAGSFEEVECGYTDEMARAESLRCAECGCDAGLACILQDYCTEYGVDQSRFIGEFNRYKVDSRHPFIKIDSNKCIRCGRCVSTCAEILNVSALGFVNRGFRTIVKPAMEKALQNTNCVSCGNCIDVCPTGSLVEKMPFRRSGPWQMESMFNVCNYCSVGCNITLNVKTDDIFFVTGAPPDLGPNQGELCVRGRFGYQHYLDGSRLKKPMIRKGGKLVEVSWDEAIEAACTGLKHVAKEHSADHLMVTASPKLTNEELYLTGRLARTALGTNNIASFYTMLSEDGHHILDDMLGSTETTVSNAEIMEADLYLFVGCNPTRENPVLGWKLKRRIKNGTEAIVLNSADIDICSFATATADPRRGTMTQLLNGIISEIISNDNTDESFIDENTSNYEQFKDSFAGKSLDEIGSVTGVKPEKISKIAELLADKKKRIVAVYNIDSRIDRSPDDLKALTSLMLTLGKVGATGSGLALLSDQCNSNGMTLAGFDNRMLPGGRQISDSAHIKEVGALWNTDLEKLIDDQGTNLTRKIRDDQIRGMLLLGENPAAQPEFHKFIDNLEFLVVADQFDTETVQMADVFLPLAGYLEGKGHFTNWNGLIQELKPISNPLSGKSNLAILRELALGIGSVHLPDSPAEVHAELLLLKKSADKADSGSYRTKDNKAHFVLYGDQVRLTPIARSSLLEIDARWQAQAKRITM